MRPKGGRWEGHILFSRVHATLIYSVSPSVRQSVRWSVGHSIGNALLFFTEGEGEGEGEGDLTSIIAPAQHTAVLYTALFAASFNSLTEIKTCAFLIKKFIPSDGCQQNGTV